MYYCADVDTKHTAEDLPLIGDGVDLDFTLSWYCEQGDPGDHWTPPTGDCADLQGVKVEQARVWHGDTELVLDRASNPVWFEWLDEVVENLLGTTDRLGSMDDLECEALGTVDYWQRRGVSTLMDERAAYRRVWEAA